MDTGGAVLTNNEGMDDGMQRRRSQGADSLCGALSTVDLGGVPRMAMISPVPFLVSDICSAVQFSALQKYYF